MALSSRYRGKVLIVTAQMTHIDATVAIQFKDEIRAEIDDKAQHVILDLAEVDFIDSSGLGAIVASMKQLKGDRKLDLAGLTPTVAKVFQLTRMDTVFKIHKSVDEALSNEGN
jgi:anti-sigma B factor antagonist